MGIVNLDGGEKEGKDDLLRGVLDTLFMKAFKWNIQGSAAAHKT